MPLVVALVVGTVAAIFLLFLIARAKNVAASENLHNLEDLEQMRALGARKKHVPLGQQRELDYLSRGANHSG